MKNINHLPNGTPRNSDVANFPNGGVVNETETSKGTPIVEEILGDIFSNIYKVIRDRKIEFTGNQDREDTQYQFFDALKLLTNNLNDSEQILNLAGSVFSLPIDFELLPNKYFVIFLMINHNLLT
jgi:hypothetical protein